MCGFSGYFESGGTDAARCHSILLAMGQTIVHRGPDDAGYWFDADKGIAFVHRRLAIVDLSQTGAQPMQSANQRFVLSYNGEIYNHLEIREKLEKQGLHPTRWLGHSDTETLLAGFQAWGIFQTLKEVVGMFAFALWDNLEHQLVLARDRFGEKPLYYGWQGRGDQSVFLFGSDLSALRAHPSFTAEVDRDASASFMRFGCIGQTQTVYKNIHKLPPGHILSLNSSDMQRRHSPVAQAFWSGSEMIQQAKSNPFLGSDREAVDQLDYLLRRSVSGQMLSDVPLGAFLSGGVDSSAIVALMQTQSSRPVKTFSIGFHEKGYNEATHAKAISLHLGTEHTELYVCPEQALAVIAKLPSLYSEPFADSSQIPTYLVSQLARQHVTVAISGDAGDELFGGYNRYLLTQQYWKVLSLMPSSVRRAIANTLKSVSPSALDHLGALIRQPRLGDKFHKATSVLASRSAMELYSGLVSQWLEPESVVRGSIESSAALTQGLPWLDKLSDAEKMMALDMLRYLPDDILTKVDRAAMSVSLETRVPFLDHRVAQFAWSLPIQMKIKEGVGKWPLRQMLYRYVPQKMIERPKMGFAVPIDQWLRGPLRDWAEDLLSEARLRAEGFFNPVPIRRKWHEHLSGKRNWQHQLWNVLMFQAWLAQQRSN
jgi:asparagine synthase (glutamine-hydrolysing)